MPAPSTWSARRRPASRLSDDYKEALDDFTKIKTFEKTTFRLAESSLTSEQIKQVSKELIALGVTGTPESGNALAGALRQLGSKLQRASGCPTAGRAGLPWATTSSNVTRH